MSLKDRLLGANDNALPAQHHSLTSSADETTFDPAAAPIADPFVLIKRRAQDALFARLGSRLYDSSLGEDQLDS